MTDGPSGSYEDIFENQGVPEQFRGPDDYFFHTVTEAESGARAGETYAIPRQTHVRGDFHGLYDVYENGAIVNVRTLVDPEVTLEQRAIVNARSLEGDTRIGYAAVVANGAQLFDVDADSYVEIGPDASIKSADIGSQTKIGKAVIIRQAAEDPDARTVIGPRVTLEDDVRLEGNNIVGDNSTLHWAAAMYEGAKIGSQVELDDKAKVLNNAKIGDKARVMEGVSVKAGKKIRRNKIVFPKHFSGGNRGW